MNLLAPPLRTPDRRQRETVVWMKTPTRRPRRLCRPLSVQAAWHQLKIQHRNMHADLARRMCRNTT